MSREEFQPEPLRRIDSPGLGDPYAAMASSGGYPENGEPSGKLLANAWHAFRRRWLIVFVLGAMCAGGAAAGMWYLSEDQYTARTAIRVESRPSSAGFGPGNQQPTVDYAVYCATQRQMILGASFLSTVWQLPEVQKLPTIREQSLDALTWLQSNLKVSFADSSEIMMISLTCNNRDDARIIVHNVAKQYVADAQFEEDRQRDNRISQLTDNKSAMEDQLRRAHQALNDYKAIQGGTETPELTPDQQAALQQLGKISGQLLDIEVRMETLRLEAETRAAAESEQPDEGQDAPVAELVDTPPPAPGQDILFDARVAEDSRLNSLRAQLEYLATRIADAEATMKPEVASEYIAGYQQRSTDVQTKMEKRRLELWKLLEFERSWSRNAESIAGSAADLPRLQNERQALLTKRAELLQLVPQFRDREPTLELEMARSKVKDYEDLLGWFGPELTKAEMAKAAPYRVYWDERTSVPSRADKTKRYIQCGAAGTFGWGLVGALVLWWDMSKRRLNTPADVMAELNMPFIGSLPLIKRSRKNDLGSNTRLSDAVDAIAGALLCNGGESAPRIVQISSAVSGEGKSTLAANLATSLAASGRKTLLIDLDLRRPMLHQVYGLDLGPGASEILTRTNDFHECIQLTPHDNFFLLTAGHWQQKALAALTDTRVEDLLQQCRSEFEFVVVDTSPVLPVVDGRLISRHVDRVIISLLRDVSEAPKVMSACRILESFGAPIMGAVMIGSSADVYYVNPVRAMTKPA